MRRTYSVAAEKGSEVVIVDKYAEKVDKIRDDIVAKGGAAHAVPFDITNNSSVDQFSQLLDAAFPQVRVCKENKTQRSTRSVDES